MKKKRQVNKHPQLGANIHIPSFWEGFAHALNFFGGQAKIDESMFSPESDYEAMKQDWEAVGSDLAHAIERFETQYGIKK